MIIASFLLEKGTNLKLLISNFRDPKSKKNAEAVSAGHSFFYFIIHALVYFWYIKNNYIDNFYTTSIIWIILVIFLSNLVYRLHQKHQKVDPNKADNDYS
jgi:isoprenylcysteine carboxyl methyltransferase (ICMT) family protein YpbQ